MIWYILIAGYPLHGYTVIFDKTRIFFKQKIKLKDYPSFRSTDIRNLKIDLENTDNFTTGINKTRIFYKYYFISILRYINLYKFFF